MDAHKHEYTGEVSQHTHSVKPNPVRLSCQVGATAEATESEGEDGGHSKQ